MSEVHEQSLVDAPVATVWELVGDPRRYPEWLAEAVEGLKTAADRATV